VGAIEALKAACIEASEVTARIESSVMARLLKRAQTAGMTEAEAFDFVEAWERQMMLLVRPSMALFGATVISATALGEPTAQTTLDEVA
jgi:hypothetical protein